MNANDAILRSAAPLADPRVDLSRTVRAFILPSSGRGACRHPPRPP